MDINTNTNDILMELDGQRIARGLSYQDLADACGVSKSTIHRTLSGATEPTMQLLQAIAAAVQYKPAAPVMVPEECTQEAYIAYLKELLQWIMNATSASFRRTTTSFTSRTGEPSLSWAVFWGSSSCLSAPSLLTISPTWTGDGFRRP